MTQHRATRHLQSGLSLVELMIGIAVGLFIVAAATVVLVNQLADHRRLLLETQVQQDLRSAADVIVRDLRRSGYWELAENGVWASNATGVVRNPYVALKTQDGDALVPSDKAPLQTLNYNYAQHDSRAEGGALKPEDNKVTSNEVFGVKLSSGALMLQLGENNWQPLTDPGVLVVNRFSITPSTQTVSLNEFCAPDLPPGATPPQLQVRHLAVFIEATATHDPNVKRSINANVRVRNDVSSGACGT